jgi:hypothetical protein
MRTEQVMKGHVMSSIQRKKSPYELADLILKHDPGASWETISNVISEWGGLLDNDLPKDGKAMAAEHALPGRQQQSRNLAGAGGA